MVTAAGRGHPPGRRAGRRTRHADGHVHPPRADGPQGRSRSRSSSGWRSRASSSRPASCTTTSSTRPPEPRWPTRAAPAPRATRRWSTRARPTLTGAGVTLNPDAYADSLTGAYVDLPDNVTAGMTELSVDYDVRIDPANVGDHHLWSFGRKTNCDATARRLRGLDLRLEHDAPAHRPERDDADHRRQRAAVDDLRAARGRLEAPDLHAAAQRERDQLDRASCTRTASRSAATTNLSVAADASTPRAPTATSSAARRSPTHYALRGTLRNFRVYDRALSADEAIALAEAPGVAGRQRRRGRDRPRPHRARSSTTSPAQGRDQGRLADHLDDVEPGRGHARAGVITRPALGQPAATATLTAHLTKGLEVATRDIAITVPAEFDDAQSVARDTADLGSGGARRHPRQHHAARRRASSARRSPGRRARRSSPRPAR